MSKRKSRIKFFLIAFFHAIWLLILVAVWLRQPFTFDYEFDFSKDLIEAEYALRGFKTKNRSKYREKFLFVNISRSQQIDRGYNSGRVNTKTNREVLSNVLHNLEEDSAKYSLIILDVFVDELLNKEDSLLFNQVTRLKKMNKIVTVDVINNIPKLGKTRIENALGNTKSGIAYYGLSLSEAFYKFSYQEKIQENNVKQLPLVAYELLKNKKAKEAFLFNLFYRYQDSKGLYQNIMVPRITLSNSDVIFPSGFAKTNKHIVNAYELSDLVDKDVINSIWPGKGQPVIVIGDFVASDMHYSTKGIISGSLIISNTLIALLESENEINTFYIIFLIFSFTIVSYLIFSPNVLDKWKKVKFKSIIVQSCYNFLLEEAHLVVLVLVTFIGIFVFDHYLFLFFFLIYSLVIEKIISFIRKRRNRATAL